MSLLLIMIAQLYNLSLVLRPPSSSCSSFLTNSNEDKFSWRTWEEEKQRMYSNMSEINQYDGLIS